MWVNLADSIKVLSVLHPPSSNRACRVVILLDKSFLYALVSSRPTSMQQEGDLCMDAPVMDTWSELLDMAKDRDTWRYRVKVLRTSPCKRWQKMMRKINRKIEIRLVSDYSS